MALMAKRDQENRTVVVNRLKLLETLRANRTTHIAAYTRAISVYKQQALTQLHAAVKRATEKLTSRYEKLQREIADLTDEDIPLRSSMLTLVDEINVQMPVPQLHVKEYDAAIDMAAWDTRDELELTHAEFTCFVRDAWDWRSSFDSVTSMYLGGAPRG